MRDRACRTFGRARRDRRVPASSPKRLAWCSALRFRWLLLASITLVACSTNPVTGRNELLLINEQQELEIGAQNYLPLRQSQGGDYVADPQLEAYVREVGNKLAQVSDRKLPYEFNVINNGVPNAWALPGGKISINRGLLSELNSEAELAAVLGHEIVHAAARHGARGQTRGVFLQLGVVAATIAGSREGYGDVAQVLSMGGAQLINSRYGRDQELESDRYGMEYMARAGYDPQGAVDLQRTFVRLSEGRRTDFLSGLFASHPPSQARVEANEATAARLGRQGEAGERRFARAMSRLKKAQPAYARFEQAQKAAKAGDMDKARTLVQQAIRIEPREAQFQSLLGDIAANAKDYRSARAYYDKAIALDDEWFYYYLARGTVHQATRNVSAARADFERSMRLMPTDVAQEALGSIARAQGDTRTAQRYYTQAARADSPVAARAREQLARTEPSSDGNARRFVSTLNGVTGEGRYAVQLSNASRRALSDVEIEIRRPGTRPQRQRLKGVLEPGGRRVIDTGLVLNATQRNATQVVVVNAVVAR